MFYLILIKYTAVKYFGSIEKAVPLPVSPVDAADESEVVPFDAAEVVPFDSLPVDAADESEVVPFDAADVVPLDSLPVDPVDAADVVDEDAADEVDVDAAPDVKLTECICDALIPPLVALNE